MVIIYLTREKTMSKIRGNEVVGRGEDGNNWRFVGALAWQETRSVFCLRNHQVGTARGVRRNISVHRSNAEGREFVALERQSNALCCINVHELWKHTLSKLRTFGYIAG